MNDIEKRMEKAIKIIEDKEYSQIDENTFKVRGYETTTGSCTCIDSRIRKMNCKHILCVQILLKDSFEGIKYEKFNDAVKFVETYNENLLNRLKSLGEVIEEKGKLIWL